MTSGGGANGRAIVLLFIAFLLGERTVAVRLSADADADGKEAFDVHATSQASDDPAKMIKGLKEGVEGGLDADAKLTCTQLSESLANATLRVKQDLWLVCIEDQCDFSKLNVEEMLVGSGTIISLVASADNKKCLPTVMGSQAVRDRLSDLLAIVPSVLHAAPTQEGRARVQETYLQLVTYQEGVLGLAQGLADRQQLISFNILDENCPTTCKKCDHFESAGFGFRCLLEGRDKNRPILVRGGAVCDEPKRRWFRKFPWARQCRVKDWKESALQHVHVSAMLTCSSITMTMGVNALMSQSQRRSMYKLCLKMEQGYTLTGEEMEQYEAQLLLDDEVVPRGVKLAVNTILSFGMASGLAGLRAATRGNERLPVLLEGGQAPEPTDYSAAYAAYVVSEGLAIRSLDRDMYGNQELTSREETLAQLEQCEDIYSLKSQNTFSEGAAPLVINAMTIRNAELGAPGGLADPTDANAPTTSSANWGQVIFGTVVGTFFAINYVVAVSYVFLYAATFTLLAIAMTGGTAATLLIPLYAVGWVASLGFGVWGIYNLVFAIFGLIFRSSDAEERLEKCLA